MPARQEGVKGNELAGGHTLSQAYEASEQAVNQDRQEESKGVVEACRARSDPLRAKRTPDMLR